MTQEVWRDCLSIRSFALKGFGTVVTGTLWSGTLRVGETVLVHPLGREARIRGLQTHGTPVDMAPAGERTAVNLAGIDHSEIKRGFVLSRSNTFQGTSVIDGAVDWIEATDAPSKREEFVFHVGTTEVMGSLKRLGFDSPFARIQLFEPVIAVPGDRFILRRPSPARTVAGGTIVDAFPPRRLNRVKTYARLSALLEAEATRRIELLVEESTNGETVSNLVHLTGAPSEAIRAAVKQSAGLILLESTQRIVSKTWLEQRRQKLTAWLSAFHANNPAAAGAPVSQARLGLDPLLADVVFAGFPAVQLQGDLISLASHRPEFTTQQTETLSRIEQAFREAGFQPPSSNEILKNFIPDPKKGARLAGDAHQEPEVSPHSGRYGLPCRHYSSYP